MSAKKNQELHLKGEHRDIDRHVQPATASLPIVADNQKRSQNIKGNQWSSKTKSHMHPEHRHGYGNR